MIKCTLLTANFIFARCNFCITMRFVKTLHAEILLILLLIILFYFTIFICWLFFACLLLSNFCRAHSKFTIIKLHKPFSRVILLIAESAICAPTTRATFFRSGGLNRETRQKDALITRSRRSFHRDGRADRRTGQC